MDKKKYVEMLCWFTGTIIWASLAYLNLSEDKIIIAIIQLILSIGFAVKFATRCMNHKKEHHD